MEDGDSAGGGGINFSGGGACIGVAGGACLVASFLVAGSDAGGLAAIAGTSTYE